MSWHLRSFRVITALSVITLATATSTAGAAGTARAAVPAATYQVGPITDVSSCAGQNAEVEQAVDTRLGYVYEEWMGCRGIAVARSADGGRTWDAPVSLPDTVGSNVNTWDPAIAVAPDGTVYASFMLSREGQYYPVVEASFDHGASFTQSSALIPPDAKNWGDRDFVAVGPDGAVYVTWDYGPERTSITYICASNGSCAFATGDLNVVMQKSTDGGRTWSKMSHISPGFPASGGDSAPLVVEPNGRVDVLYQGYQVTNPVTYTPADRLNVPHIMEVTGAGSGTAYVSWLSDSNPAGYALFLRAFSVTRGWLSGPAQISAGYGSSAVWPGDTTGLSALSPSDVVASWGSDDKDVSGNMAEIYAANVAVTLP